MAQALGVSVTIAPSHARRHVVALPVLIASAAANAWAEEVIMVGYLLTRLRQLGWSENRSLLARGRCCAAPTTSTRGSAGSSATS